MTDVFKINIDEMLKQHIDRVADKENIHKSKLAYKLILLYLKYYEKIDSKEIIEEHIYKVRLKQYIQIRITKKEKAHIKEAAKKLKTNMNEFCRLSIRRGLELYKTYGKEFLFDENHQIFSILSELRELKEYKELTENRMKILFNVITEAGVDIPNNFFKF